MKIGLFGGTFDPPHKAHLDLAKYAADKLGLEWIYFIPSARHPLKENSKITPVLIRYQMLESALASYPEFRISRIEIDQDDISYTIDTLRRFCDYEKIPDAQLYFIIGMDNINELHLWKNPDEILKLARMVVLSRPGNESGKVYAKYKDRILQLEGPLMDISSSAIREKIRTGEAVTQYLPPGVSEIISKYQLYR